LSISILNGVLAVFLLAAPQRPSAGDADALLERARTAALAYSRSLPDFVCTETVRRSLAQSLLGRVMPVNWRLNDTLTMKVSYFNQKEDHKLELINGKAPGRTFDDLGGAIGMGEFGGMLDGIFTPASETAFRWESWKKEGGRRVAVYSYVVQQAHSAYLLSTATAFGPKQAMVGYHGVLEIEEATGAVLRFTYEADRIPRDLVLTYALTTVIYSTADVGGAKYLLPSSSETELRGESMGMRNEMEFRDYNKYASDSKISYGTDK